MLLVVNILLHGNLFFKVLNVNYKLVKAKAFQFSKPSTQVRGCAGRLRNARNQIMDFNQISPPPTPP